MEKSKCIEEYNILKDENKKLKKELEHYKSILDKVNVMLHVNKLNKDGLTDVVWFNKTYKDFTSICVNDRNSDTKKNYDETYHSDDMKIIKDAIEKAKIDKKNFSFVYKYTTGKGQKNG